MPDSSKLYEATVNTLPSVDNPVYFESAGGGGGSFVIDFAGGQGMEVASQAEANTYAENLGNALKGLVFYQRRSIDSYQPDPADTLLIGSGVDYTSAHFVDNLNVAKVLVTGTAQDPSGTGKAYITITLSDGRSFTNYIGESVSMPLIQAGTSLDLYLNQDSSNSEKFTIYFGQDLDLTDLKQANELQGSLSRAFKVGASPMQFQADIDVNTKIEVKLPSLASKVIYNGTTLDISSLKGAIEAGEVIESALNSVIETISAIGSYQSRLNYTVGGLQSALENTSQARSAFLDADIGQAVEDFATNNAKVEISMSMIKQLVAAKSMLTRLVQ